MLWNADIQTGHSCHTQELKAAIVTHKRSSQLKIPTWKGEKLLMTQHSCGASGSQSLFLKKDAHALTDALVCRWTTLTGLSGLQKKKKKKKRGGGRRGGEKDKIGREMCWGGLKEEWIWARSIAHVYEIFKELKIKFSLCCEAIKATAINTTHRLQAIPRPMYFQCNFKFLPFYKQLWLSMAVWQTVCKPLNCPLGTLIQSTVPQKCNLSLWIHLVDRMLT